MSTPKPPWEFDKSESSDEKFIAANRNPTPEDEKTQFRNAEEIHSDKLDNKEKEDNLKARTDYADKAYNLVWFWSACIIFVTFMQFLGKSSGNSLHHTSFIALIVSTTGLMFGFWALVGRYLFPSTRPKKKG